jgi:hypothetical protein
MGRGVAVLAKLDVRVPRGVRRLGLRQRSLVRQRTQPTQQLAVHLGANFSYIDWSLNYN